MSEEQEVVETEETQETQEASVTYRDFINEDGTFTDKFYKEHPTGLGSHSVISRYKTFDDLVNGQINASQTISTKVDDWLGSDKEEIIKERMKLSGVPSSPDDYEIKFPDAFDNLPDESKGAISEYMKESAKWAHENGAPKELFEKFVERDLQRAVEIQQEQVAEQMRAFEEADSALKKEWGHNYDSNVQRAENLAKLLNMESVIPVLKEDPSMLKSFHDGASKLMSDDQLVEVTQNNNLETSKDKLAELDQRMLEYKGSTNDPEYQILLSRKMDALKAMPKTEEDFKVLS